MPGANSSVGAQVQGPRVHGGLSGADGAVAGPGAARVHVGAVVLHVHPGVHRQVEGPGADGRRAAPGACFGGRTPSGEE